MKFRADIAALIHEGHTDASIARRLGCGRSTAWETRRALSLPPSRFIGRQLAEAFPTGQVHDYRPDRMPTSPAQQAANQARLLAALKEAA
ncbi:helix-turn-helix domain-containing protein [Streptomyces sp. NPDC059828]|uniref:helix-turn-helix domain-containing protein n=1 Tax=Streptomyces sp. NPDC059828 TaxID=3346965 RepID=UPI003653D2EE